MTDHLHTQGKAAAVFSAFLILAAAARAQERPHAAILRAEAARILSTRFSRAGSEGLPVKCGLPILSAAIHDRATLTAGEQLALNALLQRPELQTSILADSGRFRFHFDTTGAQAPALLDSAGSRIPGTARAFVDSAIAIMAHVYQYETGTLGFQAPPDDGMLGGGPEYDIYIDDPGPDTYGLTTPETGLMDGGISSKFSTFIEIHYDFSFVTPPANRGIPSLRVTLAHEFHHAIQIGSYGYWMSDIWFHEITSVWMEDVVYHGENDYLNYLFGRFGPSQFTFPGAPLTTNDFIEYSRGILGKYLTKKFGHDTMLHIWQNVRQAPPLTAINTTLQQLPLPLTSSMSLAFAEWALWNYYTGPRADTVNYYNEGSIFPVIVEQYYELISPTQQVAGSLPCLATSYYGYVTGSDTVTVALVNLNPDCPANSPSSSPFTLTVSRSRPDDSYRAITGNLYLKLDVTNQSQWFAWTIGKTGPGTTSVAEGSAFPNPFHPGEGGFLYLPVNADEGTLSIYSSGMELVYSASRQSQSRLGQRVFTWDGMTKGNSVAPTGIYIFVLTLPGRTVTGKFALVRR
jgi:hypothetical protein